MNTVNQIICPLCNDAVDKLLYHFHIDSERQVFNRIREQHPGWVEDYGICSRCVDYYHTAIVMEQRILPEIGPHFPVRSADDFIILPTGLRLNADPQFTGRGITVCFIDSGFSPHPDITQHRNRIKAFIDITAEKSCIENDAVLVQGFSETTKSDDSCWHGTMTTVVCAGDGWMGNGLYKGIASDAELVLLKVQDATGKITNDAIIKALQWVEDNYETYGIRVVNMSLGGDTALPYEQGNIDQQAEKLVAKGIVVVAAVGNDVQGKVKPPASSINVIAVGGADDNNQLGVETRKLYHSTFGKTANEYLKPELLAHAIWIAAPILRFTFEEKEAQVLYELLSTADECLPAAMAGKYAHTKLNQSVYGSKDITLIRQCIIARIQEAKYISAAYMHVDGTSFAAPMVTAVIAQMLEADPSLTPAAIRHTLFRTAKRIAGLPAERQGFGLIQPRKALLKVLKKQSFMPALASPFINYRQHSIEFYVQHDCASQVALAGSFNNWAPDVLLLQPGQNAVWKITIPLLPEGRYQYKFFVDDTTWLEDAGNPHREPDGFNGLNSILTVASDNKPIPC